MGSALEASQRKESDIQAIKSLGEAITTCNKNVTTETAKKTTLDASIAELEKYKAGIKAKENTATKEVKKCLQKKELQSDSKKKKEQVKEEVKNLKNKPKKNEKQFEEELEEIDEKDLEKEL